MGSNIHTAIKVLKEIAEDAEAFSAGERIRAAEVLATLPDESEIQKGIPYVD